MALVEVARAIMNLSDDERLVMAEELGDCADLDLELSTELSTARPTIDDLQSALLMWANHLLESQSEAT